MCGHIGTEMGNKAETVLVISRNATAPQYSQVQALHIREKEFKPFAFKINDEGLPELSDDGVPEAPVKPARMNFRDLTEEQHREALSHAFGDRPVVGFGNMVARLIPAYEKVGFVRGRSVMIKLLDYLTNDLKLVIKQDKVFYYDMTPAEEVLFGEDECSEE